MYVTWKLQCEIHLNQDCYFSPAEKSNYRSSAFEITRSYLRSLSNSIHSFHGTSNIRYAVMSSKTNAVLQSIMTSPSFLQSLQAIGVELLTLPPIPIAG